MIQGITTEDVQKNLGNRIKALRREQGLTQENLGDLIGLDRTYIASVENGHRNISLDNLIRIADGLDITLSDLLRDVDAQKQGINPPRVDYHAVDTQRDQS